MNVPVAVVALMVTSSVLTLPFTRRDHRIDFEGAALLVAGNDLRRRLRNRSFLVQAIIGRPRSGMWTAARTVRTGAGTR
mgnify:CR=1 FL=1